jgi:hypothetical protein
MMSKFTLEGRSMNLGKQISNRIRSLPEAMQEILLADFQTAIENRLKVMERIQSAHRRA